MNRTYFFATATLFIGGLLTGCSVMPVASDTDGPNIRLTQISRGEVIVFDSTDGSVTVPAPDVCPSGTLLLGWVHQVDQFPVEVLISATDRSGVKWLRLNSADGILSSPDPATVSITTRSVGGTEYYIAQQYYPDTDPRSARFFKVRVEPRPGNSIASIEGGAMDFNDNQTYTFVIPMGTNEALCEEFE